MMFGAINELKFHIGFPNPYDSFTIYLVRREPLSGCHFPVCLAVAGNLRREGIVNCLARLGVDQVCSLLSPLLVELPLCKKVECASVFMAQ